MSIDWDGNTITNPIGFSTPSPLDVQVGGNHYKQFEIQPVEFCQRNKLGFCESSVIKYVSRWKDKGGIADLEKAKHFIDMLIQIESRNNAG